MGGLEYREHAQASNRGKKGKGAESCDPLLDLVQQVCGGGHVVRVGMLGRGVVGVWEKSVADLSPKPKL